MELTARIPVGISACMLGLKVRHDKGHKHARYCTETLAQYFDFKSLCPEMGAGLPAPRKAMHLAQMGGQTRLITTDGLRDHTALMDDFIQRTLPSLASLRGFVLMAKSPSCGMERVKIYGDNGHVMSRDGVGQFADALMSAYPAMPVEESGRLNDPHLRENFVERVYVYDDWCSNVAPTLTAKALIAFHSRHKFQLLAHCQATYRNLGPLLADLSTVPVEEVADTYIVAFMTAMKKVVSRGAHVNTLQHLAGFLKDQLDDIDHQILHEQIAAYQREDVPLIVPMTLLRGGLRKVPKPYVSQQGYLAPYPDQLGLRNAL